MPLNLEGLPFLKAHPLEVESPGRRWLIESLWARRAVGLLGGPPKSCKSWLGLDMALSVASDTPCRGRFPVREPGAALVYLAEDHLAAVRSRIESLCRHRGLRICKLDLCVITASVLRLDLERDQRRLDVTLSDLRPRLLVLDPLVRLHRLDENSAGDLARLLGFLRHMQRRHQTAIVLVHHAGKKQRLSAGQNLRGSSDLHAFGDSNLYLSRRQQGLTLTLEHRAAPDLEPLQVELVCHPHSADAHLQVCSSPPGSDSKPLTERAWKVLQTSERPLTCTALRSLLRVNNQRLGTALDHLQLQGRIFRTPKGWLAENAPQRRP